MCACVGFVAIFSGTTQQLRPRTPLPTVAPVKAMTKTLFVKTIAEKTKLKQKDVRAVFSVLKTIVYNEVKKTGKFVIPGLVVLKLKRRPAMKAVMVMECGMEIIHLVPEKRAKKEVTAFPARGVGHMVEQAKWKVAQAEYSGASLDSQLLDNARQAEEQGKLMVKACKTGAHGVVMQEVATSVAAAVQVYWEALKAHYGHSEWPPIVIL